MAHKQIHPAQVGHSLITNIFLLIFLLFLMFVAGTTILSIFQQSDEPAPASDEEQLNLEFIPQFDPEFDPEVFDRSGCEGRYGQHGNDRCWTERENRRSELVCGPAGRRPPKRPAASSVDARPRAVNRSD